MKLKKKGFTLIELLAVIVILGILLAIAVPSVAKYLSSSRKSAYQENAQYFASTARDQAMLGTFKFPVNNNEATIIHFEALKEHLDKGGKNSSYGNPYVSDSSFVVIANVGTAEEPNYELFIAAIDDDGYGIGTVDERGTMSAAAIAYDSLTDGNILQLKEGSGMQKPTTESTIKVKSAKLGTDLTLKVTSIVAK